MPADGMMAVRMRLKEDFGTSSWAAEGSVCLFPFVSNGRIGKSARPLLPRRHRLYCREHDRMGTRLIAEKVLVRLRPPCVRQGA